MDIAFTVSLRCRCVIRGCVPKKLLVYGSEFSDAFKDAQGFGWAAVQPTFDWNYLIESKVSELWTGLSL